MSGRSNAAPLALVAIAAVALAGAWWLFGTASAPPGGGGTGPDPAGPEPKVTNGEVSSLANPDLATGQGSDAADDQSERDEVGVAAEGEALVRAVDADTGQPIERAYVKLSGMRDLASTPTTWGLGQSSGPVSVPWAGEPMTVQVNAHRYRPAEARIEGPGGLRVELARATSLVGIVRDADSAPVHRAKVTLEYLGGLDAVPGNDPQPLPGGGKTLAVTDEGGAYAFTALAPGHYRVRGVLGSVSKTSDVLQVQSDGWTTADLWFTTSNGVTVTLLQPGGSPSARSRVMVSRDVTVADEPVLAGYTDDEGRVTLGPLDPGPYFAVIVSDHGVHEPAPFELSDDPGARVTLDLRLETPSDDK